MDRDGSGGAGLKAVLSRLREGKAVVLFPEGTRSADGQLQSARSGIGLAVIKSGAAVLPVRVFGTNEAWGRHQRFPHPHPIVVTFGRPLNLDALRTEAESCSRERLREIYQEVADQIMAGIAQHYKPDDLFGKSVVVVFNLQSAKLMGQESQGMLLAASDANGKLVFVTPSAEIESGSVVR